MLIDKITIEEVTEKYHRSDYEKLREDLICKRDELIVKRDLLYQVTNPLRKEIGELKAFIETDTIAQILKKYDTLKCVEELRERLITQIIEKRDNERAMDKEIMLLREDIHAIKLYLARGEGLSFEIEPSGFGLDQGCFNCGLTIDYDFCHALLDGEDQGAVCVRCISLIEKDPARYIRSPYHKKFKNVPSLEAFYKAGLEQASRWENGEKEKYIKDNLAECFERDEKHIQTLQEHRPLKENNEG